MSELLEAAANIGAYGLLFGLAGFALYELLGPQVFGVPAIIGVLVIAAGVKVFEAVGLRGLLAMAVALVALVLVIGIAMTLGPEGRGSPAAEKPQEDLRA
jgi:hypothetical protein